MLGARCRRVLSLFATTRKRPISFITKLEEATVNLDLANFRCSETLMNLENPYRGREPF